MAVPVVLAIAGLVLVLGSWVTYMATVPSGKVPVRPLGHLASQGAGALAAAWGIASAYGSGVGVLAAVVAGGTAITMSSLFFFLYSQRATPLGRLRVKVGDPLRPFTALTPEGETFDSASLQGRRVLLKFFRGHW